MSKLLSIQEVNDLGQTQFAKLFENIIECCPEAANAIWDEVPFGNVDAIANAADKYLDHLPMDGKERVLQLHPDLGGRLAEEGKLTAESTKEQKSADLQNLSAASKTMLEQLNARDKFGFPFVICARENKAAAILKGLEARLKNSKIEELETGIEEVKKICKLRILELVEN